METYTTYDGQEIDLSGLTAKEREFLTKARQLIAQGVAWDTYQNFYLDKRSPIWFEGGDSKAERKPTTKVTRSPLFRVVQDMGVRLGIELGFLKAGEGKATPGLTLEQFEEKTDA